MAKKRNTKMAYKRKENSGEIKSTESISSETGKNKERKIPFDFHDSRFRALLILITSLAFFGFIWINPASDFNDPWYDAIILVDSSTRVHDPALKEKLLEEGGGQLRFLLKEHPYHARLYYFMGIYYSIKQNWDSAIYCQRKAIFIGVGGIVNNVEFEAQSELIAALYNKGNTFLQAKSPDSAIAYYEQAVKEIKNARPTQRTQALAAQVLNNISIAHTYKGNALAEAGMDGEAISAFEKAVFYVPNKPDVYNNIGILYSKKNNYAKAEEAFKKALELNPTYDKAKANLENLKNIKK